MEKEYYTPKVVEEKFGLKPSNFILHKVLLGDNSDNIRGVKGLGAKGIFKKFPELKTHDLTLDDIFDISARKFKDHVVYSRIVQEQSRIETNYKVMDLSIPMIDDRGKEHIEDLIVEDFPDFNPEMFIQFYNEDKMGGMIRNLEIWLKDIFSQFKGYKD
jgi:5'-3' exonuclease